MTDRKFYRSVFTLEVLSKEPIPDNMNLMEMVHETVIGDYNGSMLAQDLNVEINGKEAATRLILSSSDAGFFQLDANGNEIE